jgi:hypothetical protein
MTSSVSMGGCGDSGSGGASSSSSGSNNADSGCGFGGCVDAPPGCVGLQCQQVTCDNGGKTTVTGRVLDPAGKVPVYNATVYVPNGPLDDITSGVTTCDRCDAKVSGAPLVITATNTKGEFTLENVPVGEKIPLVVQIGKWRRRVEIPSVGRCVDTPLDAGLTRLPKNRAEGSIPRIAVSTGGADPLQCLLRKIGLDDAEFGVSGSEARVHMFAGGGFDAGGTPKPASAKFAGSVSGGADFPRSDTLWADKASLSKYDIVLLSCEGGENENAPGASKLAPARQALYDYAKTGGRVFASHYHEMWFRRSPEPAVSGIATWAVPEKIPPAVPQNPATTATPSDISAAFPKAVAMREWLTQQNALVSGKLPVFDARHNIDAVGKDGLAWISASNPNAGNQPAIQYMSFNTPVGAADDAVCGRVVLSDLHVGAGSDASGTDDPQGAFPDGCKTTELTAQQKALEFMLFDLSSCIQNDGSAVRPPK